jgi:dolichyl-phosphate-mannose-protein mannosyltransferase
MSASGTEPSPPATARPATGELIAIASVLLLGGVLRWNLPSNMAVEHFDEGVYASNVWFAGQSPAHYPMRQLYAPPLLPAAVEWLILLFGPDAPVPMLVNLVAGTATILVLWWIGRTWFGTAAGITAAALCAFSDFHILYTRTVLTDPLLAFWLIAAVFCLGEGHRRRNRRWLLAGGLLTGLAWWTKYNGWLPLAIQISGVCGWMVFGGKDARRNLLWHVSGFVLAAVVAGVVIAPMFAGLSDVGGYATVAENHRGYLVGWPGWWDALKRHAGAHWFLEGYVSVIGAAYAVAWGLLLSVRRISGRFTWNPLDGNRHAAAPVSMGVLLGIVILAAGLAAALGTATVLAVFALLGLAAEMWFGRKAEAEESNGPESPASNRLPWSLLAAWFLGLLVATPLYRAYPRLSLPWLASAWLAAGAALQGIINRRRWWPAFRSPGVRATADRAHNGPPEGGTPTDVNPRAIPIAVGLALLGGLLFYAGQTRFPTVRVAGWQNRGGFRPIAAELSKLAATDSAIVTPASKESSPIRADNAPRFVLYVYGEPGLFYQLSREQQKPDSPPYVVAVAPEDVGRLTPVKSGSVAVPTYLVTGPHADRDAGFRERWGSSASRFRQVGGTLRYRPSDLVLLNELPPDEAADPDRHPQFAVRLFRVK